MKGILGVWRMWSVTGNGLLVVGGLDERHLTVGLLGKVRRDERWRWWSRCLMLRSGGRVFGRCVG